MNTADMLREVSNSMSTLDKVLEAGGLRLVKTCNTNFNVGKSPNFVFVLSMWRECLDILPMPNEGVASSDNNLPGISRRERFLVR